MKNLIEPIQLAVFIKSVTPAETTIVHKQETVGIIIRYDVNNIHKGIGT